MHFLKTTLEDFQRPLNTTLEDSIHMPQNHNNRNNRRRQAGSGAKNLHTPHVLPPLTLDASGYILSRTTQTPSPCNAPVPFSDDANSAIHEVPRQQRVSTAYNESHEPVLRGLNEQSGSNTRRTGDPGRPPLLQPDGMEIRNRIRRGDFRSFVDAFSRAPVQDQVGTALASKEVSKYVGEIAPGKVLYSKIHEQQDKFPNPSGAPKTEGANDARSLSEEPSPLKVFKKSPRTDTQPWSPMVDRVMKLRAEQQEKKLAEFSKDLASSKSSEPPSDADGIRVFVSTDSNSQRKEKKASVQKQNPSADSPEFIPDMELSDSDWATPFYVIANQSARIERPEQGSRNHELDPRRRSMVASIHSAADSDNDEIDLLTEAMADMRVFQQLASSPPEDRAFKRRGAMSEPCGMKAVGVEKAEEEVKDLGGSAEVESKDPAEVKLVHEEANKSKESIVSFASEDFERIGTPTDFESEHNGVRRKWYRGFLR